MDPWFTRIQRLLGKDTISYYENILFKRGFRVLLIQLCGLIIAFAANILLARLYGAQVYGIYSLVTSWCVLLAIFGIFGMDDSHSVQLPTWKLRGENKKISQQLKWSLGVNTISILIISVIFYLILHFFKVPRLSKYIRYFNYGLLLVIFLTIMNNLISFLRGMDKVVYVEIIDKMIRPFFLIISLLVFYQLWKADLAAGAILASSAGLFCTILLLSVKTGKIIKRSTPVKSEPKKNYSLKPNFRYVLLTLLYFLSTRLDILLLSLFSDTVMVGHYNAAAKFADISSYPVAIINLSLPTMLSTLKHEEGREASPRLLYRISKNSFFQCLFLSCLFLITGNWILNWYGKGFGDAFPVLAIFLASNLITTFIGSADVFFIMEGRESRPIYSRIIAVLLTIALAAFLIPKWQMAGAAISMLLGNLLYCILIEYFFFTKYRFFIHPFASKKRFNITGEKR